MTKETVQKPFIFVLFGATGDLALKKIFPALEALHKEGAFASGAKIVAVSRRDWDDRALVDFLKKNKAVSGDDFSRLISYSKVDIEADTGYAELAASIERLRADAHGSDIVYYSALAPAFHGRVAQGLRVAGLLVRGSSEKLLIEKPFGTSEKTACELDLLLESLIDEEQIFRIDHYLGKDTVRAIMDIHERTPEFSNLISAASVRSIRVRLFEEKGIGDRGASYDGVGAFRDVGQNHMLEMLAALAAEFGEKAGGKTGADWQSARAAALSRLAPPARTCEMSRRGQYEGYAGEEGVRAGSTTETAFEVVTSFLSGKLKGIPVTLEAGKKMGASEAFVEVSFKDIPELPRRMIFRVQPEQEVSIEGGEGPDSSFDVPKTRDAYGNIILAALAGSRREFVGREEIEALWSYADHVVACWGKVPLETYGEGKPFLIK
ncbi:hypothetical protein KW799_01120 [Candidatus Parcubacteria bacterium]|nr:hypothetical protein [Candidatus Parcubacteria bacterium]